jgi:hypothetical protein
VGTIYISYESGLHVDESFNVTPYWTILVKVPNAQDMDMFWSVYKFYILQVPYV